MLQRLTVSDFESFFALMELSFPTTERRTKEDQRALFDAEAAYRVYGLQNSATHKVEAFLAVWDLDGILFVEHFAVDPTLRGQGIGSRLLAELAKMTDKPLCLEVEPPCTDLAIRRIAFYKRNGFFLNEFPYLQPSLAKGEPPIPLMVMTLGKALSKEEFEQVREELYRKVYHVEPMSPCEYDRFYSMKACAEHALKALAPKENRQAIVLYTKNGNQYSAVIENALSEKGSDERALLQKLNAEADTEITDLLCLWQNGSIDLPSYRFRKQLIACNKTNQNTKIFVLSSHGYQAVALKKTILC